MYIFKSKKSSSNIKVNVQIDCDFVFDSKLTVFKIQDVHFENCPNFFSVQNLHYLITYGRFLICCFSLLISKLLC
jgi:hypothetical protein